MQRCWPHTIQELGDSPFKDLSFSYFHREDFEDHLFNVPGVSANTGGVTSIIFGPSIHDSVDGDDGGVDGSGLNGDSYFSSLENRGIVFTFDVTVLGSLPTYVGVVWTDGAGHITFQTFGPAGQLLTTTGPYRDVGVPDGSFVGTTGEDRFFGISDPSGISAWYLSDFHPEHWWWYRDRPPSVWGDFGDSRT
jgi:hypothetical protein